MTKTINRKRLAFGVVSMSLALSLATASCSTEDNQAKPGPDKGSYESLERTPGAEENAAEQEKENKAPEGNQNIKEKNVVKPAAPAPPVISIPDPNLQKEIQQMKIEKPPTNIVSDKGAQRNLPKAPVGQNIPVDIKKKPVGGNQGTPNTISINGVKTAIIPTAPIKKGNDWIFSPSENVKLVSWYQDSAEPLGKEGNSGSVLMSGHINNVSQGTGFGAKFTTLKPGDIITIVNSHGKKIDYKVATNKQIKKRTVMPPEVNRAEGPESLVLITCSGAFIGGELGYQNNSVVEAFPLN